MFDSLVPIMVLILCFEIKGTVGSVKGLINGLGHKSFTVAGISLLLPFFL